MSLGTGVSTSNGAINPMFLDLGSNKFMIIYPNYYFQIGTVSGTSVTLEASQTNWGVSSGTSAAIGRDSSGNYLVTNTTSSSPYSINAKVYTGDNGTSLTGGGTAVNNFVGSNYAYAKFNTYNATSDKFLVFWTSSNNLYVRLATLSGTTPSSTATLNMGIAGNVAHTNASGSTSIGSVELMGYFDSNQYPNVVAIQTSGSNAAKGTAVTISSTATATASNYTLPIAVTDAANGKFIVGYVKASDGNLYVHQGTLSGTTITLGAEALAWDSAATLETYEMGFAYDTVLEKFAVVEAKQAVFTAGATTNAGNWIGIAQDAATNGNNVKITLPTELHSGTSGLTIDADYYLSDTGTLSTSGTRLVGRATSATQLLVADNQNSEALGANSPALSGVPTAPTASSGTNTTQIATTAFVLANAGGSTTYSEISGNTTAVASNVYIVNTGSAVTLTLPASASIGDKVGVIDGTGQAATNNITIGRNSHKIQGDAADMTVSLNRAAFELVYYNATHGWLLTKV